LFTFSKAASTFMAQRTGSAYPFNLTSHKCWLQSHADQKRAYGTRLRILAG
jgi:hypothetical protein